MILASDLRPGTIIDYRWDQLLLVTSVRSTILDYTHVGGSKHDGIVVRFANMENATLGEWHLLCGQTVDVELWTGNEDEELT